MREDGQRTVFSLGDLHGAGRILFFDGLEELQQWKVSFGRYGQSVSRSQSWVYCENWSGKLIGGLSLANGFVETYAYRDFVLKATGDMMVRAVLGISTVQAMSRVALYVVKGYNTTLRKFGIRINPANAHPQIINELGEWSDCDADALLLGGPGWHLFEFVVDWTRGVYLQAKINSRSFLVKGISFYKESVAFMPAGGGIRIAQWMSGAGLTVYFDDVCIYV